jgi:hypothetical protein
MDIKHVKFERTGGFAGIRLATDFELGDLLEDQISRLSEILDHVDFFKLPEKLINKEAMADGFTYSISIESEARSHAVTTSDTSAPEELQPLLELLTQIARQQMRKNLPPA